MNLYRIRYAWSYGGASSSEVQYYESVDALKVDLLAHHLDIMYETNRRNWFKLRVASLWRERRGHAEGQRRTTRLINVEKIENDEWVPVEYSFIEPGVILGGQDD